MTTWTPRERALREALEMAANRILHMASCQCDDDDDIPCNCGAVDALGRISAALADPPPPDPRDEALRLAITALETASGAFNNYVVHHAVQGDEVKRAKNQSLRDDMDAALAAIAAAKGEG